MHEVLAGLYCRLAEEHTCAQRHGPSAPLLRGNDQGKPQQDEVGRRLFKLLGMESLEL